MKMRITVEGKAYEVEVEMLDAPEQGVGTTPSSTSLNFQSPIRLATPVWTPPRLGGPLSDDKTCRSPIAGLVTRIIAQIGQKVRENDPLLVIEAMKMESNIACPTTGTVKSIAVKSGDGVKVGQTLVEFD
jgi:methylmalonyl-CoA carboxyltransferase small subunit